MSDLIDLFGDKLRVTNPPDVQLKDAIAAAGLTPPSVIELDGKIHRFNSGTKKKSGSDKSGWYVAFSDGIPAGRFGCWRSGIDGIWRADIGREITHEEELNHLRRLDEARRIREADDLVRRAVAQQEINKVWANSIGASADHPYLLKKNIGVHGARVTDDGRLVVPLFDDDGSLSSLQYIDHSGGKLYHRGGVVKGRYWSIGTREPSETGPIYVAEGFATAATIHQITKKKTYISYGASNLPNVVGSLKAKYLQAKYKNVEIIIVADNDESGTGQSYAEQASAKYGARVIVPPIKGDANDYVQAGHDLASLLNPPADDWLIPYELFRQEPMPISWLIKGWLQSQALIMVHGPSGDGKTFVVLDWCLRMASGKADWMGLQVKPGAVVYLAGEGHQGLKGRVEAWSQYHGVTRADIWLSRDGCDLNTPPGYQKAVQSIRRLSKSPKVIAIDTLHRFLKGDENSAQDTKTMLDACSDLMREFNCTVILVHHTGVSEEAQHRGRGSSAWRGALDIEISISRIKDGPISIVQRKNKDAELSQSVYVDLRKVDIDGWSDSDGEPMGSAVVIQGSEPIAIQKDSIVNTHRKTFENAWRASGTPLESGYPFLSRTALVRYLIDRMGVSEATAAVYVKASNDRKIIGKLINAEIIKAHGQGWIVTDKVHASSMKMLIEDSNGNPGEPLGNP